MSYGPILKCPERLDEITTYLIEDFFIGAPLSLPGIEQLLRVLLRPRRVHVILLVARALMGGLRLMQCTELLHALD